MKISEGAKMIFKVLGFGILTALTSFLLSELGFKGRRVYSTLGICILLLYFLNSFGGFFGELLSFNISDGAGEAVKVGLKIVGVSQAFSIAADAAGELSEGGIASTMTLVGKLEILIISLPHLKSIISTVSDLLSKI
jgi:hypothetical protein